MPLLMDERTAVQILMREADQHGFGGLNNFARTVLGAHAEQAKRLSIQADSILRGNQTLDETFPPGSGEDITVTRTVEGREMSITLKAGKLPITSYQELVDFYEIDTKRWRPTHQTFNFWGSDASPNFQVKANFREMEYQGLTAEDREEARDWYATIAPKFDLPPLERSLSGHLLEIVVSDLHADKVTTAGTTLEDHLERVQRGVRQILVRANPLGIERIALVFLGDTFDHDGDGATTNGTQQESHGPYRAVYVRVRDFIAQIANACSVLAPVDLYVLSGNHDRERAFYALDSLHGLLSMNPRIEVHLEPRRAYLEWGTVLIGLWHGDRQKQVDVALTLLRERDTAGKRVLEVHLGHEHHRQSDEIHGVLLRRFRAPTPDNEWAEDNLFNHAVKSITGIVWHRESGEVAEFPVSFVGESWMN
jgi:hypothetical protein